MPAYALPHGDRNREGSRKRPRKPAPGAALGR